jgi:hexosaminidase
MALKTPSIIPYPASLKRQEGEFILQNSSWIQAPVSLAREADYFAGYLRKASGFPLRILEANGPADSSTLIHLLLDSECSHLGPEGYRLSVEAQTVELRASTSTGIFYGIQTLLQLFPPAIYGQGPRPGITWTLPQLEIEDFPRFPWRGAMLDCCRHFQPIEFVRKFIDLMALHKLNVFHWHLTDDQGWRIEIKKYPRLTEIGAWRRGTWMGHDESDSQDDGLLHGGFYSQEQVREIVRYAAERHITIVPEIEMPGHAQAALAAYPEFGCREEPVEVRKRWGISETIFRPREETFCFLQDVLVEVMELFPGRFIHIGGDEAVKVQWDSNPDIQAFMLSVGAKNSHELQSYFIRRMDRFLTEHGQRLIGWDEILEGGLAEGAAVMCWRSDEGGITAVKQGHDVIMALHSHTYFDHYQSQAIADEPLAIGGFLPLEKVYGYEPVPKEIPAEQLHHVLGVQGQLWAEYMPTTERVEYMAFPRLCALAETAWSPFSSRNYDSFLERLKTHLKRLDILKIKYRPPTF